MFSVFLQFFGPSRPSHSGVVSVVFRLPVREEAQSDAGQQADHGGSHQLLLVNGREPERSHDGYNVRPHLLQVAVVTGEVPQPVRYAKWMMLVCLFLSKKSHNQRRFVGKKTGYDGTAAQCRDLPAPSARADAAYQAL